MRALHAVGDRNFAITFFAVWVEKETGFQSFGKKNIWMCDLVVLKKIKPINCRNARKMFDVCCGCRQKPASNHSYLILSGKRSTASHLLFMISNKKKLSSGGFSAGLLANVPENCARDAPAPHVGNQGLTKEQPGPQEKKTQHTKPKPIDCKATWLRPR